MFSGKATPSLLEGLLTCMETSLFSGLELLSWWRAIVIKDRPLCPLPSPKGGGNFFIPWSCICRSKRGKVVARTETREDLCPKFSSTKKKHRTSWMSLNGKLTKATSESLVSQVIMRDNFSPKGSCTLNCFPLGVPLGKIMDSWKEDMVIYTWTNVFLKLIISYF